MLYHRALELQLVLFLAASFHLCCSFWLTAVLLITPIQVEMLKDLILFGVKRPCLQYDLQEGIFCPWSFRLQAVHEGSGG